MPRKKTKASKTVKTRLAGFTKLKGKFRLVLKKGKKLSLGRKVFNSKTALMKAAAKRKR